MVLTRAETLANRLLESQLNSDRDRISYAYQLLFARDPSERETLLGVEFVGDTTAKARMNVWTQYTHVLLASNEFLFVN